MNYIAKKDKGQLRPNYFTWSS